MYKFSKQKLTQISKLNTNRTIANVLGLNLGLILGKFSTTNMTRLISTPDLSVLPSQCLSYTEQILPDLIGRYYMDKASANKSFNDMQELIVSLKESFHQILEENQWMDATTKANSIKKLNAITEHIAFPDYTSNDTHLLEEYSQVLIVTNKHSFKNFSINAYLISGYKK